MRTIVDHTVMFLLDGDEGDVIPTYEDGQYGRVSGVTVHLREGREPQLTASVRRCRKDGSEDGRFRGGNVHTSSPLPNADEWIERAKAAVAEQVVRDAV